MKLQFYVHDINIRTLVAACKKLHTEVITAQLKSIFLAKYIYITFVTTTLFSAGSTAL